MSTVEKLAEAKKLLEDLTIEDCGSAEFYGQQMQKLRDIDAAIEEAITKLEGKPRHPGGGVGDGPKKFFPSQARDLRRFASFYAQSSCARPPPPKREGRLRDQEFYEGSTPQTPKRGGWSPLAPTLPSTTVRVRMTFVGACHSFGGGGCWDSPRLVSESFPISEEGEGH